MYRSQLSEARDILLIYDGFSEDSEEVRGFVDMLGPPFQLQLLNLKDIYKDSDGNYQMDSYHPKEFIILIADVAKHYHVILDSVLVGKNVLVEPPFTITEQDAKNLQQVAVLTGSILQVHHKLEMGAGFQELKRYTRCHGVDLEYLYFCEPQNRRKKFCDSKMLYDAIYYTLSLLGKPIIKAELVSSIHDVSTAVSLVLYYDISNAVRVFYGISDCEEVESNVSGAIECINSKKVAFERWEAKGITGEFKDPSLNWKGESVFGDKYRWVFKIDSIHCNFHSLDINALDFSEGFLAKSCDVVGKHSHSVVMARQDEGVLRYDITCTKLMELIGENYSALKDHVEGQKKPHTITLFDETKNETPCNQQLLGRSRSRLSLTERDGNSHLR